MVQTLEPQTPPYRGNRKLEYLQPISPESWKPGKFRILQNVQLGSRNTQSFELLHSSDSRHLKTTSSNQRKTYRSPLNGRGDDNPKLRNPNYYSYYRSIRNAVLRNLRNPKEHYWELFRLLYYVLNTATRLASSAAWPRNPLSTAPSLSI